MASDPTPADVIAAARERYDNAASIRINMGEVHWRDGVLVPDEPVEFSAHICYRHANGYLYSLKHAVAPTLSKLLEQVQHGS